MKTKYKFIHFEKSNLPATWICKDVKRGFELGEIFWDYFWKEFVFCPRWVSKALYNSGRLRNIADFMDQLNKGENHANSKSD